jgi:hypothetical protein
VSNQGNSEMTEQEQKDLTALIKKLTTETFESQGFIKAVNCPSLRGRIITDRGGIQYVETDSKEEGKRLIPCLGKTRIAGGEIGDFVEMTYMVHKQEMMCMWTGKLIEKGRG